MEELGLRMAFAVSFCNYSTADDDEHGRKCGTGCRNGRELIIIINKWTGGASILKAGVDFLKEMLIRKAQSGRPGHGTCSVSHADKAGKSE